MKLIHKLPLMAFIFSSVTLASNQFEQLPCESLKGNWKVISSDAIILNRAQSFCSEIESVVGKYATIGLVSETLRYFEINSVHERLNYMYGLVSLADKGIVNEIELSSQWTRPIWYHEVGHAFFEDSLAEGEGEIADAYKNKIRINEIELILLTEKDPTRITDLTAELDQLYESFPDELNDFGGANPLKPFDELYADVVSAHLLGDDQIHAKVVTEARLSSEDHLDRSFSAAYDPAIFVVEQAVNNPYRFFRPLRAALAPTMLDTKAFTRAMRKAIIKLFPEVKSIKPFKAEDVLCVNHLLAKELSEAGVSISKDAYVLNIQGCKDF